ncbi:MAG TPA: carboxypeptidase-like regulatory domain-containing protein [Polyangiaceae bacterium]|nr:carboxypeptidase-like regulatory domain-containing protein [Polyangiaceae bacterium]
MLPIVVPSSVIAGRSCHSLGVWSVRVSSAVLLLMLGTLPARAADSPSSASDAQPGVDHVGVADVGAPALAATLGYGYTEKQNSGDGAHHRLSLRAAGALPVLPWLSVGPIINGRYDLHPHDTGGVIDAAVLARASMRQGSLRLGADLRGWLPGAESFDTMLKGASLDARALAGASLDGVELAGIAGIRLDRTSAAGTHAATLGSGDRLALGLSDYDAVLLGLGAIVPLGRTELLAETSLDLLVGKNAPSFGQSPFRVSGGVRQHLSEALTLEVLAVGSLSRKPDLTPGAPLVPNEPRFSAFAGIRYRFLPSKPAPKQEPPPPATAPKTVVAPPPPPAPVDAALELSLLDDQNSPVNGATAHVTVGDASVGLAPEAAGHYRNEHVRAGTGSLRIEAAGFQPLERPVAIQAGVPQKLDIVLTAVPPPSQVRGLVRSLSGKGLVAKIRVEPLGTEITTDAEGAFRIDVPPGSYDVVIEAHGYATQRRHVSVDAQGVVVVNAELVKKK